MYIEYSGTTDNLETTESLAGGFTPLSISDKRWLFLKPISKDRFGKFKFDLPIGYEGNDKKIYLFDKSRKNYICLNQEITPDIVRSFMNENGIKSVKDLAELIEVNYSSLNEAIKGSRQKFSSEQEKSLRTFFVLRQCS